MPKIMAHGGLEKVQQELFNWGINSSSAAHPSRMSFLEKVRITFRLDQAILGVLILLLFYVLVFSWGVEKGKHSVTEATSGPSAPLATLESPKDEKTLEEANSFLSHETQEVEPIIIETTSENEGLLASKAQPVGKYTIQHITYLTQPDADRELRKLANLGHDPFIIPSGKYLQVCLNRFKTRGEAFLFLRQLKAQGIVAGDAYVRPVQR